MVATMKTKAKAYLARYERDEAGWWVATIQGKPAQSQGRTLEQARERVREALAALLDVAPARLVISDDIRLPPPERRALALAKEAARRAAGEADRAEKATRDAARTLIASGMSLRDAGLLLGVSRQRVHQILEPKRKAG
jgi:predicted RNase H-like HicB family nuclease